jgi:hypothetical protein
MFNNACSHPAMTPPPVALPTVDIAALKAILPIVRHKHAAGQHLNRAG